MSLVITEAGSVQINFSSGVMAFTDPAVPPAQAPIYKLIPSLTANMNACTFGQALLPASLTVVTLPASPTQLLYAKHLGIAGTITFTWTPVGSGSAQVMILQPGGMLFFFNPTNGVTTLSVQASLANTPVDYVLAG
jgi:hypothetical protein